MSTIASPRDSSSVRSPSSSRTSLDFSSSTPSNSAAGRLKNPPRRNRTALRDYYNLKATDPNQPLTSPGLGPTSPTPSSELDLPSFSPSAYVSSILATQSLSDVLRTESQLVAEIKGLDGERKALVYDNYSKLIAATETIARMRGNMDPLTPATSTLAPAVAHIAETARVLSEGLASRTGMAARLGHDAVEDEPDEKRSTVRWVLDAPRRLEDMLDQGRKRDAEAEWHEVDLLLDRWKHVGGVAELRERCMATLDEQQDE